MIRDKFNNYIQGLQDEICKSLELTDGQSSFKEDEWQRPGGGGGKTRVMQHGAVFEKAGVNTSAVEGTVTDPMRSQLKMDGDRFFACGLSLVLHPFNPFVPTVHANFRYFELYDERGITIDAWFGGGADLTPYYLFEEDAMHFHRTWKDTCDRFDPSLYQLYKKQCDQYFVNRHRGEEARGIGGIFFDYLRQDELRSMDEHLEFTMACGRSFLPAYVPIVEKRKHLPFEANHKYWQEIRRGRYVEFNLVHDRGTLFGLKTNGRTESILMSLPPTVRFDYDVTPEPGSEEHRLMRVCLQPVDWV